MNEIRKLLTVSLGPKTQGKSFVEVICYCDFEGHGRASEDWEEHWKITLPVIKWHWKNNKGDWIGSKGTTYNPMDFHGKTFDDVKEKAIKFLTWYNNPEKELT